MADDTQQTPDHRTTIWAVLDEVQQTVEGWPAWRQRYRVDLYREVLGDDAPHGS
ncbi:MAG: hypothetical protein JO197_15315 [Acidobacteria bacterium]|nr:hypothetical protein [Acidobacteriota bacterium]MBV9475108.1 hypothetical protein [Acidobacteriota bacterium]